MAAGLPPILSDRVSSAFFLSPGVEINVHRLKFYADVEVPAYQNFTGNQLVAPLAVKATMAYEF